MKKILLSTALAIITILIQAKGPAKVSMSQNRAPLSFMENKGQVMDQNRQPRPDIQFSIKATPGLNIFIGNGAIHYQFSKPEAAANAPQGAMSSAGGGAGGGEPRAISAKLKGKHETPSPVSYSMYRMDVELLGANTNAEVITEQRQDYYENYFNERTGEKGATAYTYNRITYKNIYPSIDWVLYMKDGQLEHEFVIHDGGKASDIQLQYGGATGLKVNADGSLTAATPQGTITEQSPKSYQPDGTPVKSGFKLSGDVLRYETGGFKGEMVIDPGLVWGTYFGGSLAEQANGATVDGSGNVYIAGWTNSMSGIATTGAYQTIGDSISADAFVAKFNSSGLLQWATYYGGTSSELLYGVAADVAGNVYITGETFSGSGIATIGAYQTTLAGITDAFLAKFSSTGSIQWATYFGGPGGDWGASVATDESGNVYLTGLTQSASGITTAGAYQVIFGGAQDAFLAKFNGVGTVQWATYYGGIYSDNAFGVTTDGVGNVYMAARVQSPGLASPGAFDTTSNLANPMLVKFSSAGSRLWATYYGGVGSGVNTDGVSSVAADGAGNVYITGHAYSRSGIASPGAYQPTIADTVYGDAYLAKFSSSGARQWGTYYGGSGEDFGTGIATDNSGHVYITGGTESTSGIATSGSYQTSLIGVEDAFMAEFDSAGLRLWATYYGGSTTQGNGIATDGSGNVYLAGQAGDSANIGTPGAYQTIYGGQGDAILAKFSPCNPPTVFPITGPTTLCALGSITLTDTTTGGTWGSSNTSLATVSSGEVSGVAAGLDTITYSVTNGCGTTTVSYPVTVNAAPTINAVSNQTVCAGDTTTTIHFTGTGTGTVYNWTCNNTSIGLAASGTGNIGSFTAVNTGNTPVVDTITVTPVAPQGYAYIPGGNTDYVSVINTVTNTVIDTIHVGNGPVGVAVSPDGSKVYVTSSNNVSTVSVINTATNLVTATISVGVSPVGIAVSPDGSKVFVANQFSSNISVINATTNLVTATINVPTQPWGITVSPDGSRVYVTRNGIDTVSVINTATNLVTTTIIPGGGSGGGVLVSPDGSKAYVSGGDTVSVINTVTNTISASINVGTNQGGGGISISTDGNKLYVAGGNSVKVINTATNTITANINVGSGAYGVSISPDGSKVYVANLYSSKVFVINTSSNTVIDSVTVGSGPFSFGNFVTGGTGCTGPPPTFTITVNPQPTAGITGTATACGSVSLTATGGTTYTWSGGNTPNNADNTFTSSGTYAVTVSNGSSCSATAQQVVTVNTVPTAGITGTAIACGSVNLTATGGGTYAWSGGNTPNNADNTFASSGTYTVTVTNTSCTATVSQAVTVNTAPTATYTTSTGRTSFCQGDSLTLMAAAEHGYLWSTGATTQSITVNQGGNTGVTVTDNNGCTASTSENISAFSVPTSSIVQGDTSFCQGDSITLTSVTQFQYLWSTGATTQNITVKQGGNYVVIATNPVGCSDSSAVVTVIVNAPPSAAISGPTNICANLSATLTASGGAGYRWSNGLGTNASVTVSPVNNTTYTVTVTDAHTCTATAQQTVSITSAPTASITGPAQICYGYDVILYAHGGNTYAWSGGLGTADSIEDFPTQPTTYTVTVSIGANCSATASQTVNVYPEIFTFPFDTICAGQTYPFGNRNLNQSGTYNDTLQTIHGCDSVIILQLMVNDAAQTAISDTTCKGTVYVFNGHNLNQAGVYKDTLNAVSTCDSIITLSLVIDSTTTPTITRTGDSLQTQIFASYQWLFNGAIVNGGTNQNLVVVQDGNYSVVVTGGGGCGDTSAVLNVTGLGINDIASAYGVKLYPNPNNGNFMLQFTDDMVRDVEVTDAIGRTVVTSFKVTKQQNFNLNELAAGIYFMRIATAGEVRSLKFSVER